MGSTIQTMSDKRVSSSFLRRITTSVPLSSPMPSLSPANKSNQTIDLCMQSDINIIDSSEDESEDELVFNAENKALHANKGNQMFFIQSNPSKRGRKRQRAPDPPSTTANPTKKKRKTNNVLVSSSNDNEWNSLISNIHRAHLSEQQKDENHKKEVSKMKRNYEEGMKSYNQKVNKKMKELKQTHKKECNEWMKLNKLIHQRFEAKITQIREEENTKLNSVNTTNHFFIQALKGKCEQNKEIIAKKLKEKNVIIKELKAE